MPQSNKLSFYLSNRGSEFDDIVQRVLSPFLGTKSGTFGVTSSVEDDIRQFCNRILHKPQWRQTIEAGQPALHAVAVMLVFVLKDRELMEKALPWALASKDHFNILEAVADRYGKDWMITW